MHAPEHSYAVILASQPMGFYSPTTLVQDTRKHGVRVVGPSVNDLLVGANAQHVGDNEVGKSYNPGRPKALSSRSTVTLDIDREPMAYIGLSQVRGLSMVAEHIVEARHQGTFTSQADPARRAYVSTSAMGKLVMAGALECLEVGRHEGAWTAGALVQPQARAG